MKKSGRGRHSSGGLGRSLIKDKNRRSAKHNESGWLHSAELDDGTDWGRLNLHSVTEESQLDEFLNTATLAGTEFVAERLNIKVVSTANYTGLPSEEETARAKKAEEENRQYLGIPRRPHWDKSTTAEELESKERDSFLEWRRNLAKLQENEHLTLTPFERNLDFWRQLWRVVERSDIVVQIVDARNPLLFRCEDLEKYVNEIDSKKVNMILISKADLLTPKQRQVWAEYFRQKTSVVVAFWSAILESGQLEEANPDGATPTPTSDLRENENDTPTMSAEMTNASSTDHLREHTTTETMPTSTDQNDATPTATTPTSTDQSDTTTKTAPASTERNDTTPVIIPTSDQSDATTATTPTFMDQNDATPTTTTPTSTAKSDTIPTFMEDTETVPTSDQNDATTTATKTTPTFTEVTKTMIDQDDTTPTTASEITPTYLEGSKTSALLTREELIDLFLRISPVCSGALTTVGMVGYPNVGKSSTINTLFQGKKVPVSATPGRTKHFQTLFLREDLLLCDCPGLVFPTFLSSKAEMICNGILPIDQLREHTPPVSLVCQRIPRPVLEQFYGIAIPPPKEGEARDRVPYAHELLAAYGYMRGYMTSHGRPDEPRSARYILKDYVNGKLLYCHPPPGEDEVAFNHQLLPEARTSSVSSHHNDPTNPTKPTVSARTTGGNEFDSQYFQQEQVHVITKGIRAALQPPGSDNAATVQGKPWKKHHNRNKKEKTRRLHRTFD